MVQGQLRVAPLPELLFREQQGVDQRLVDEGREIGILARDHAVARLQLDCHPQVLVGAGEIAGEPLRKREGVVDVFLSGRQLQGLFPGARALRPCFAR